MKSKTKIEKQAKRKLNPELVETIRNAKKNVGWLELAGLLSRPRSQIVSLNLDQIDKEAKEGDSVVIPGKVLGQGDVTKKIRIAAMGFSGMAIKKLEEKKCEFVSICEEIKVNPKAEGVKILK